MNVSCECQNVVFKTPLAKPLALYICHCNECKRQSSSAFGASAIFPRFPLPCPEFLAVYTTPGKSVVSVKGGCIEGLDWKMAKHIWVKRAMVPIPEGAEVLEEEPDYDPYICRTTDLLENGKMDAGAA
ncbi:uncharacterized protein Bfra_008873 [Botrytis fragariae]|uniref:CENP-V/GFA domain-containing protein n=1 Tax=Botrytis fragariae TaxID=1964551 RepID=A0A8H6EGZ5_9HELO|nr:uncharacterized protein Bfra_008873 [Botrytis fragariae]KAF5871848.1 hypothetical protein Bfra_008873 [Botrytis fragariae]